MLIINYYPVPNYKKDLQSVRSNLYSLSGIILAKKHILYRQVSYRMTISLFQVCAGHTCSAVSPLPENFCDNFGGDPITDDGPHAMSMRQVLYRNGLSCGTVLYRTYWSSPGVMNLKLHHRQMHYRQRPFLNDFTMKTTTKRIENMLPGHQKLKIY